MTRRARSFQPTYEILDHSLPCDDGADIDIGPIVASDAYGYAKL